MTKPARTPEELHTIEALNKQIEDAISTSGVDRQIAIDAVEYTLGRLVCEALDSEAGVKVYADWFTERIIAQWRRWNV